MFSGLVVFVTMDFIDYCRRVELVEPQNAFSNLYGIGVVAPELCPELIPGKVVDDGHAIDNWAQ